ncbi:hypothetical protein BDV35DRAFT_397380 [Aspergillus flavus]|uniref:DNA, SC020 n=4 Tax=Aspergillus subgen. Circumdati TaxID=2720871 RepID=Q2U4B0_ASPOR|nr:unnamed protein product [Aspergillus oryzae RIB40]EIT81257.1 hypothetical protein Ao3042_02230 [Aspergillus oryzae 3.042]KAB8241806.1 hypothetical protein BDV35DRAFT_397380 [Aspergillus flavus]KDE75104.1 hypothetical protein AO1008_11379 [Aspergillus oryzae 100-8]OOO08565.1 hypothetical protein OAory_01098610 [Aspergillus oryzae]BAE63605.1 unnamed protein product [Aspergillus oryzae RIB40]|eukprot:EIT81257.1 hypothetical protein Ao3042_02230 [Aspergillus oryzae 3.042]
MGPCSGKKQWYVCSQGPFQGCCSVDPCSAGGVCPDDDDATTVTSISTSTKVHTVTPTKPVSSKQSTFETSTTTTSRLETSNTPGTTTASTTSTSSTSTGTGTSVADNVNADAETGHGTPVGAIVGGVIGGIAFLILLAIALCIAYRRGKKRVRQFTFLRSPHTDIFKETTFNTDNKPPQNDTTTTEQVTHAPTKKEKAETSSLLTPTDYSTNGTTPISPTSTAAELDAFHLYPPQSPYTLFTHPNASTPEPSDTGVYTPRAELPAQPTRELINTPHDQRQSLNQSISSQGPTHAELPAQPCRELINVPHSRRQQPATLPMTTPCEQVDECVTRANSPPVVTTDGVVLSANFDTSASPEADVLSTHGLASSHAMSFMDYDTARRSMLPAHRPEWVDNPGEGVTDKSKGEKHSNRPE